MLRKLWLIVFTMLFGSANIIAQSNSVLKGQVVDQNKAVIAGATVTLTGDQVQGRKDTVTDDSGNYVFLGLAPGNYQVLISKSGFKTLRQDGVQLRATQTLDLNLTLEVGEAKGTVEIKSGEDTPIVDTGNPEKNYNISGEFITQLPLNSRQSWEALWTMVPGVGGFPDGANFDPVINGAGNQGNLQPFSQNIVSNSVQNSYTLNGFNIGNSFTNQGWRTQFSTEAIQDVVVKTAGADASTPLGSGGSVNIVTKSGSNKYHGSLGMFMQPRKFNWTNIPGGTSSTLTLYQPDISFGGPIVFPRFGEGGPGLWKGKDKLWFFATYRKVATNEGIARSATTIANIVAAGFAAPDFDRIERSRRITAKISYQMDSKHSFVFNYLNDFGKVINSDVNSTSATPESTLDILSGGPSYQIAWTGNLSSNFLWTAQYGFRSFNADTQAKGGNRPSRVLWAGTTFSGGNRVGNTSVPNTNNGVIAYYDNKTGNAASFVDYRPHQEFTTDATWLQKLWGDHTIQSGLIYRPGTRSESLTKVPAGGTTVIDEVLIGTTRVPFRQFTWTSTDFVSSVRSTEQLGFYVQDKFRINPRLTISFGSRFDNQKSFDALGRNLFNAWTINPRVGFAISLNRVGRDVIRGSWGRYSDLLTVNAAPGIGGNLYSPGFQNAYDNTPGNPVGNLSTIVVTPPTLPNSALPTSGTLPEIDPDLSVSYKDEFQLGYTRQLPLRMVFDASYIQSDFKDIVGTFNRNLVFTNGLFTGLVNNDFNAINVRTNLRNFKQKFRSFQMSLIRNIGGRYSFFTNFTYQKRTASGDFLADDPQFYLHPAGWFDDDKQIRPWLLAANGDAKLWWGFKASVIYTIESGNYGGYLVKLLSTSDPEFTKHIASISVTNSAGVTRLVSNPLRTQTRLLNPRSDGRLQLPTRHKVNLRFGKNFALPWEGQRIETAVDIFNVFNDATPLGFANATRPDLTTTFGTLSSSFVGAPRGVQLSFRYRF